jgi:hypothetical protein
MRFDLIDYHGVARWDGKTVEIQCKPSKGDFVLFSGETIGGISVEVLQITLYDKSNFPSSGNVGQLRCITC